MNFLNILNCQWLSQSISQIILTIAGIGFIRLLYKKYISPMLYLMKLGIKFPLPKPFIGNCTDEGATNQHIAQLKRQEKYGNINGTLFFSIPTIWIGDPNVLKAVTVKEFSNFTNRYKFVKSRPPFDDSVLQLDNAEWKRVRSILMQAFSAAKLKEIVPILTDVCKSINEDIEQVEREQRSIEIWRESGKFSMKVMLAIAFGLDFESKDQEQKLTDAAATQFRGIGTFAQVMIFVFGRFIKYVMPWVGREFNDTLKYLTQTAENVIKERRKNLQLGIPCRKDILQQMIEAGNQNQLSNQEIVAQSVIFLTVGYETTANTLAFACYLLATNPAIQNKLLKEIDSKCPDSSDISYDTLFDLPYLEMVISETLRIYPPVFFVNREVKESMTIDGVQLGQDVMLGIPIYAIHHNPNLWPNPEEFIPERFSPEEKSKHHPYSYIPFGSGPRNCLGFRLALLEVKVALVSILQRYEFTTTAETVIPLQVKTASTLSPASDIKLGFRRRH